MKKTIVLSLILLLCVFLGGCNNKKNNTPDGKTVNVYYIDSKTSGLVSEKYKLITTEKDDQIGELLYMLKNEQNHMLYKNALTDDVLPESDTKKFTFDNNSLVIDFEDAYNEMDGVSQILCRAAIVKTLSQIEGVKYVQFNVKGQPLKDLDGDIVGSLTAEDFIDSTETSTSYKVKLYFANKKGDALVEYNTDINYTGTETIEELVIQQLINGPTKLGLYSTIPEGTTLLNVSKADGICTVDFNEKFLDKLPNISEEVAIYSVVNTLVELPDIDKVQFTINSEVKKTYWEDKSFEAPFDSKLDLIETPN